MLYNDRILFLHYPKTAGKSANHYLCHNLARPVHGIVSPGQHRDIPLGPEEGVHLEKGSGHENLARAFEVLAERDIDPEGLDEILVIARNPYDLAVSKYHYLRETHATVPEVRGRPNFEIAVAAESFAQFCREVRIPDFARYVQIGGRTPRALRILRYERLGEEFRELLSRLGRAETHPMPHLNRSGRGDWREEVDEEAKAIIDERFAPLFDLAGYPRSF